jgi:hypothetical protein
LCFRHGLKMPFAVFLEFIRLDVLEVVASNIVDQVTHRRTLVLDKLIRDIPHPTEGAIDELGTKIEAHKQDAVAEMWRRPLG